MVQNSHDIVSNNDDTMRVKCIHYYIMYNNIIISAFILSIAITVFHNLQLKSNHQGSAFGNQVQSSPEEFIHISFLWVNFVCNSKSGSNLLFKEVELPVLK